jgi:crotonobetaine/carnitine-CoA ligase
LEDTPTTLSGLLEAQADALGDKPFLTVGDRTFGFADFNRQVNRAAHGLAKLGVKRGVGVSIMMANSPEWLFVYFATQKLGAYAVPVNAALKGEGLRHVIDHSDSSVLACHPDYADAIGAIRDSLTELREIVVDATEAPEGWTPPQGWRTLAQVMDAPDENPGVEIDGEAICALLYTSGTTGAPKGVVNRYKSLNLVGIRLLGGLFHANALFLTTVRALVLGLPMALSRRFSASRFWDEIRRYGVTTFNALGAMIPILMKQPERPDDAENPVRMVFSAACPASVWEQFEKRFGVHIVEGYAAVDGGGFAIVNFGNAPKGSIGKPMNPIRIIDDDGNEVPQGQPGELLFEVDDAKRRRVEYYKNEEASNTRIRDGWFHTGDMVCADEDGNLYFVDRKTDSLRRRGENISSWEVEREIDSHPAVLESAVLKPNQTLGPEELVRHCQERMAKFMVPRYIEFREELPKTETHRIQKGVLKREGVGPNTWDREAHKS